MTTITDLRPAPPVVDIHQLRKQAFVAATAATSAGDLLDAEWHVGIGVGITLGLAAGRDDREVAEGALEGVASYRQGSYAGAADAETVVMALAKCFSLDMATRAEAARACGVMRGFALATADRRDAASCANCGDRILTDVMLHETCPAGTHPVMCDDDCAKEVCGRRCARDAGLL